MLSKTAAKTARTIMNTNSVDKLCIKEMYHLHIL